MNTRMNKYHNIDEGETRVSRNRDLYGQSGTPDVDSLSLNSNVSVIDSSKLQSLISERDSRVNYEFSEDTELEEEELESTKEYDLKKVIDEARKDRPKDYDSLRFKKLRESEYEILNNLNLKKNDDVIEPETLRDDEATIVELMKTVNLNAERRSKEKEEMGLMSSLMSEDNTEVLEPVEESDLIASFISEESDDTEPTLPKATLVEELEKTKQLSKTDIMEAQEASSEESEVEEEEKPKEEEQPLVNTFYTGNLMIKDSDLDDFKDLQKELKSNNVLVKILIIIIVIIVLGLGVYLLNNIFNLGLF